MLVDVEFAARVWEPAILDPMTLFLLRSAVAGAVWISAVAFLKDGFTPQGVAFGLAAGVATVLASSERLFGQGKGNDD